MRRRTLKNLDPRDLLSVPASFFCFGTVRSSFRFRIRASSRGFYNILVIISRNQKLTKTDSAGLPVYSWTSGQNFIWISIGDPHTDQTLAEGYWSGDKLFTSKTTLDKRYTLAGVIFTDLTLSKFNIYSKWQDFSREITGSKPSEEDYLSG